MDPTYLAWAKWKNSFRGVAGQYAKGFFEYDGQWDDIGHFPLPRTHTIAIGKHLSHNDKWKHIVHEATYLGRVAGVRAPRDRGHHRPLREAERE